MRPPADRGWYSRSSATSAASGFSMAWSSSSRVWPGSSESASAASSGAISSRMSAAFSGGTASSSSVASSVEVSSSASAAVSTSSRWKSTSRWCRSRSSMISARSAGWSDASAFLVASIRTRPGALSMGCTSFQERKVSAFR